MTGLRTSYDFTLPRGFIDHNGILQKDGTMRLATARDELEPLRDPSISGPDDPRLTILVLSRVVERLGTIEMVNEVQIGNLFAVDLAFLQDFYGVINFGTQADFEELMRNQSEMNLVGSGSPVRAPAAEPEPVAAPAAFEAPGSFESPDDIDVVGDEDETPARPAVRAAVEEIRRESR